MNGFTSRVPPLDIQSAELRVVVDNGTAMGEGFASQQVFIVIGVIRRESRFSCTDEAVREDYKFIIAS